MEEDGGANPARGRKSPARDNHPGKAKGGNEAETLARQGEIRAAIRKAYIALLVELGDRKIISLAQHKTNRDYLRAVINNPSLYGNMDSYSNAGEPGNCRCFALWFVIPNKL